MRLERRDDLPLRHDYDYADYEPVFHDQPSTSVFDVLVVGAVVVASFAAIALAYAGAAQCMKFIRARLGIQSAALCKTYYRERLRNWRVSRRSKRSQHLLDG